MEPAPLLAQPGEAAGQAPASRTLLVCCDGRHPGAGIDARRGLANVRLLTAVRERIVTIDLVETTLGETRLASDNPFLSAEARGRLDARGIITEGAVVGPGEVLASVVVAAPPPPDRREPTPGMQWVCDGSERVPAGWEGARVVAVQRQTRKELGKAAPKGLLERVGVTLCAEDDLAIGDVLLAGSVPLGVVGRLVPDEAMPRAGDRPVDLVLPAEAAKQLGLAEGVVRGLAIGRARERGADALQARGVGAYSLVSLRPLGNTPEPGQCVRAGHVRWLFSRGLTANLAELVSLKSDDLGNRERLRALLVGGTPAQPESVPAPGAPESLCMLQAWLQGLSLEVGLTSHSGHVDLAVRAALTGEIIARSGGPIRLAETIHYKTHEDVEGGLFCPKVFGPTRGWRRRRCGHVALPVPVVPLLWRTGAPSVLERLLELPADDIERLVRYEAAVDVDGASVRGGAAVRALLRRVPEERLPSALRGRADALVPEVVAIIPHDFRPLVLLTNGNFATADINDLYRRLINLRNRLAKLGELKAPPAVIYNTCQQLQDAADAVWANVLLPETRAAMDDFGKPPRRLVDCLDMVVRDLVRGDAKRVDWSGRARAVADVSLVPGHAWVPRRIVEALQLPASQPVLLTSASQEDGAFVAVLPEAHDDAVLRLARHDFDRLGLAAGAAPTCIVHRPLGRESCAEAARLLQGDPGPVVRVPGPAGWVDGGSAEEVVAGLIAAALSGKPVCLETPRGLLIGGPGALEPLADDACPDRGRHAPSQRQVPTPPEPPRKRRPSTHG
jgi:hypothetical protein